MSLSPQFIEPPTKFQVWKRKIVHLFETHPWLFIAIVLSVALADGLVIYAIRSSQSPVLHPVAGYVEDVATLQSEYEQYRGRPMNDRGLQRQFERAAAWADRGDFNQAATLLETLSKQAALPVIFNDLGVIYEQLHDPRHAAYAFQQALAKDPAYPPARANLERFPEIRSQVADAAATEAEPNDGPHLANPLNLDQPMEAEVKDVSDADYFTFTTPAPPRDRFEISIVNRSQTLAPHLRIFDSNQMLLSSAKETHQPGESTKMLFSPEPNSTYFVNISGENDTVGAYTLRVKPLKAFDHFEPNDQIFDAHKISLGETLDANVMDGKDTDYYSFDSPKTGSVTIDVANRSAQLIPAITTFNPDLQPHIFAPTLSPGESLHHTIQVQQGQTYYIEVSSQANTYGDYSLIVR